VDKSQERGVSCHHGFSFGFLNSEDGTETSVRNYHYLLRNIPEEHSSHLLRSGTLKSREECAGFRVKYISDDANA